MIKTLLWSTITAFAALEIFIAVYGLKSGRLLTNLFSKISMFLLGGTITILPIIWAIYEVSK